MKTSLYHIHLNVSDAKVSLPFYKDLFAYFEYKIIDESPEHIGVSNGTTDLWIIETEKVYRKNKFHRKNTGINHLAFRLNSKEDVDKFTNDFLKPKGISTLYDTPKIFPEYGGEYYAVFFEDPDRMKLEVMFKK
jgi:catechol 2,3-dioxygenase-like lactoylglutathione lyase family enzyme